ncbi:cytochrome b [Shewanella sp. D64]|uniref:cytochrome b n=1 Tax=unclassified Shewanella TaxID=196818 RepID=UPI0022BA1910|nr:MULTISPECIES: cytochrome b [unclassified Shewanella]MEC4728221.1 cytochrome b [Shewanella sp. D64]MEC4739325.1 cytochrome b [Shewanella sp. E94]WBJ97017.1 cytochrome b [Shewanella sp. MTB7]
MFRNTEKSYGVITILTHWISAVIVLGLFFAGVWMVELTYYSSWYKAAPDLHKSIGIILFVLTVSRIIWQGVNPKPAPLAEHRNWEVKAGKLAHGSIYLLLLLIMSSGYLISTADGRGISVFNLFEVPSIGELFDSQADIAGSFHQFAAYCLVGLIVVHMLGALKHHFVDKDLTLIRMIRTKK